jgi:hypothetical protein
MSRQTVLSLGTLFLINFALTQAFWVNVRLWDSIRSLETANAAQWEEIEALRDTFSGLEADIALESLKTDSLSLIFEAHANATSRAIEFLILTDPEGYSIDSINAYLRGKAVQEK